MTEISYFGNAMDRMNMSARAYDRILKVARTIADLEGTADVLYHHMIARHQPYRNLDRALRCDIKNARKVNCIGFTGTSLIIYSSIIIERIYYRLDS